MTTRRSVRHLHVVAAAAVVAGSMFLPTGASAATTPYPSSIAAAGDSITRAYDVTWWGALRDNPAYSWSTGTNSSVNSQYSRLLRLNPAIAGRAYNDARTGAKMSALDEQLKVVATQAAGYVTVLMGANDICTSTIGSMTPSATVQAQFRQAMADLTSIRPGVKVFVSSIPNIYQLWSTLHTNRSATSAWRTFGICQSMLSASNTEQMRQQVVTREREDNAAIAAVCTTEFTQSCRWDNYATFNVTFTASDVSTVDYFHPSVAGQAKLAATTWNASFWGSAP